MAFYRRRPRPDAEKCADPAKARASALETLAGQVAAGESAETALGELLFKTAALARQAGLDPEQTLQKANAAFTAAPH